ncbi:MAG: DUF1836 domain-containing protein [Thermoflexaceae bacterium]|nr:DUF1836 domain-containing protein [Thermoflexaceae bacterium]
MAADPKESKANDSKEFVNSVVKRLAQMTYIRPDEIPNIDLYMDQVTTFMEDHLNDVKRYSDDKILTKTMINNYAKNDLLPPPVKKKYSKDHMIMLIFIYYFKNILSIGDIQALLTPLSEKFFQKEDTISLDKIYKEIYNYERSQMGDIARGISRTQRDSESIFANVEDEDDRKYLQLFSLVCMLSFDVFAKKHVIENVIDELNSMNPPSDKKSKKER